MPPPGNWCSGLQELTIPWAWVVHRDSLAALQSMPALQMLQLRCRPEDCTAASVAGWERLLEVVGNCGRLQQLQIARDLHRLVMDSNICAGLLRLQQSRPALAISFRDSLYISCDEEWTDA